MLQDKIADLISRLKKVREENGLSYQRILDLVEQNGGSVSMYTIRRVFEEGSEAYGWQFENTLKPISDAVLGVYAQAPETEGAAEDTAEALRAVIRYKNERLAEMEARLARCEESYQRRLDFIKGQIDLKDARIDRLHGIIERMVDALLPEIPRGGAPHVHAAESETGGGLDLPPEIPHG